MPYRAPEMPADPVDHSRYSGRASPQRRIASLLLALAVLALILAGLLNLGVGQRFTGTRGDSLTTISLTETARRSKERNDTTQRKASEQPEPQPEKPQPPVPKPPTPPIPGVIPMSRDDFAAADIGKLTNNKASNGAASGANSPSIYGPGQGPQGAQLFRAEWYREPTNAELAPYLPSGVPPGAWADIACRTTDNFHVENCQVLTESPPGSGLAHGLRRAAWQFLVRPPMRSGEPLIGSWVRIHFDFRREGAAD